MKRKTLLSNAILRSIRGRGLRTQVLLAAIVCTLCTISLVSSLAATALRTTRLQPKAPVAASKTRQSTAPAQSESAKQTALDRERALQAQNAADAVRATELREQIAKLSASLERPGLGEKKEAKLRAELRALAAELARLDPSVVTAKPSAADELEPNDEARGATQLEAAADRMIVASGSIARPGDVDVYAFDAPAGARVWAYLDPSDSALTGTGSHDTLVRLLDTDGYGVLETGDDGADGSGFGRKVKTLLASSIAGARVDAAGRYFVDVRAFDASATMESYRLVLVVSTQNAAAETASNDSAASATPLVASGAVSGLVSGAIERAGDVDYYSVHATGGRPLFVGVDGDPTRSGSVTTTRIELLDADGSNVVIRSAASGIGPSAALAVVVPNTGTYILRVASDATGTGGYTLLAAKGESRGVPGEIPTGPFCGDTSDSALTQVDALSQDGIASTCTTTKTCPGSSGPNVKYVAYPFLNTTGVDTCITVSAMSTCTGNSRVIAAAYLSSFDPNDLCTNYLADPGSSIGSGEPVSFSFNVPAGDTFIIVMSSARPGNDCGEFCFTLGSVPCTVECPADITVGTGPDNAQCGANVEFSVSSPCSTEAPTCTIGQGTPVASGDLFPVGTTAVTCTLGGSSCTFNVTVTDTTAPTLTCPAPTTATANAECQAAVPNVLGGVTASDNCSTGDSILLSQDPPAGTLVGTGATTITVTATDAAGNMGTCTTTFTVNDTAPPEITCPGNVTVDAPSGACAAVVNFATPTATDICSTPTVACVPASGSSFDVGTTTVTCTATDASGNTDTCTFTVTVNDVTPPSITCPANVTVNAPADACAAVVNYTTPTASDNCAGVTVACLPASGSSFPVGTTTVTCTATAANGQTSTCTFTVTVNDVTAPAITCPANITVSAGAECTAVVEYATPTATDNCMPTQRGGASVNCTPASGSVFPLGTTTVTCIATDASGNTGSCTFTVTVNDTTAPSITCPANVTVDASANACSAVVNYTTPTPTDNCGKASVVCTPASGSSFPVGTTTVTCTATDGAKNSSNCTFTVTVNDVTPPTVTCPANVTVNAPANACAAVVNYTTPTGADNCSGVTVACVPASGSSFPVGSTTVTCTATATNGQTSSCTFTVTVNDTTPPAITCPANITVSAGAACTAVVNYTTPTSTDGCSGAETVTCTPASGSTFPLGTTTVTCSATDDSGNTGTCTFTVTVNDTTAPTITCPANITVGNTPGQCGANVTFTPTGADNCSAVTFVCTPASGSFFNIGTTTVSCTARDAANNTSAPCTFTVTVNDTQPPTITCPANMTVTATTPNGTIVTYPTPTVTDNCAGATTVTCVPASGSFFPNGTTVVTCTASGGGGSVTCGFSVTVARPSFDLCAVADENNTLDYWVGNSKTGYWEYHENGTCRVFWGVAESILITSFSITLKDMDNPLNRMSASFSLRTNLARVSVSDFATGGQYVITDYNFRNSVCPPPGYFCAGGSGTQR